MPNSNYREYPLSKESLETVGEGPVNATLKYLAEKYSLIRSEDQGDYDAARFVNINGGNTEVHLYFDGSTGADFYDSTGLHLGTVISANTEGYEDEAPQGAFIQSHESNELKFNSDDSMVYVHNLTPPQIQKIMSFLSPEQ
jgi:hypothetical protein